MSRAPAAIRKLSLASRALAAIAGGYVLASLVTAAIALLLGRLGVSQAQALLAATMASFPLYAAIIMAVFHARSAARAWAALVIAAASLAAFAWLLLPGGAA
ncbi:ABC-type transport system involved in multi-copper enzyme maturation permease subunit [Sphingobium sp. OAS761]|uniref:hypothetical protein n=1 Tax=Sphingobium sp. OAS761 TaxID=2817901 RepID=UPI00209D25CB|nr:hypothetical protein [Sphingobium sp. OAS761]MCP1469671.1 ABC-type transport system involved in multi-copper enzyme maturation permease subunit [Sphingobium sp. OAS761]